jgi:hypothetical protein
MSSTFSESKPKEMVVDGEYTCITTSDKPTYQNRPARNMFAKAISLMPQVSFPGSFRIGVDCSQGLAIVLVVGEPCGQHTLW